MLKLKNVSMRFRTGDIETTALDGIDLDVEQGEYLAITGPSGCGKSTLLTILGLLDTADEGEYWIDGHNVVGWSETQLTQFRRGRMGYIFQSFNLVDHLTVQENIALALRHAALPSQEKERRVQEVLTRLGVVHRAGHHPSQLSGGQQQRVAIARAVVARPKILLADEPTGNLDSHHGSEVMAILRELNEDGVTVIMVTHSESHAAMAHRRLDLMDGRVFKTHRQRIVV